MTRKKINNSKSDSENQDNLILHVVFCLREYMNKTIVSYPDIPLVADKCHNFYFIEVGRE